MDTKQNSEKEFPGLPSYYMSKNPPSEVQVKWVLDYIRKKLWNKSESLPVDDEILDDFGIVNIEEDFLDTEFKVKSKADRLAIIINK